MGVYMRIISSLSEITNWILGNNWTKNECFASLTFLTSTDPPLWLVKRAFIYEKLMKEITQIKWIVSILKVDNRERTQELNIE